MGNNESNSIFYFSDREKGPMPRIKEEISHNVWGGIVSIIRSRIADSSFGYGYPEGCPDGYGTCGCDEVTLGLALQAEIPKIDWPLDSYNLPSTLAILDLIEFCFRKLGKPIQGNFHSFFGHYHLTFDPESGQSEFRNDINRIFSRNGIAYEINKEGLIVRVVPEVLKDLIKSATFNTGDVILDDILKSSLRKFLDPDLTVRRESLEKLWDAWERLKTIESPEDKKKSVKILLDKVSSEPIFRNKIEVEASELTKIGNEFMIRHTKVTKTPLENSEQVDYLFHRMYALIQLILITTGKS